MESNSSMEQQFIEKLIKVIDKNMHNENFGVAELAEELGMNRVTLHRKVKSTVKKSVSEFIREARLKRAKELLMQNAGTVAEIAYKVGFNSATYFSKCFHDYYGYSPVEAINHPETEDDSEPVIQARKKRRVLIVSLVILFGLIAVVLFVIIKPFTIQQEELEKTIAVLSFRDDSPEQGHTYIVNGLMEDILNNLEKIKDLKVQSRTSVEQYRNSEKSIQEIAKELNVNYIVEGSAQKIGKRIKIMIQLIEAKSGNHLWSKPYVKEVDEEKIFELQSEVAFSVAKELEAIITPEEKERITKKPTDNLLAYDYYLRGQDMLYSAKERSDGHTKAISYFKKALEHDSTYAHAHAFLSFEYRIIESDTIPGSYASEINIYADKAMLYDPQLDWSLIAKSMYYEDIKEYEMAILYMEKAVEYNPNSWYAIRKLVYLYNTFKGDFEKSLEYALKSVKIKIPKTDSLLSGTMTINYYNLGDALRRVGFFKEAINSFNKCAEINPQYFAMVKTDISQIMLDIDGDYQKSKEFLIHLSKEDSSYFQTFELLAVADYTMRDYRSAMNYYKKSFEILGKDTVWRKNFYLGNIAFINSKLGNTQLSLENINDLIKYAETRDFPRWKNFYLCKAYSFLGDQEKAMKYMRLISQQEYIEFWQIRILKDEPIYDSIRDLPEFQKLLSDMESRFWENHERVKANLIEKGLYPIEI